MIIGAAIISSFMRQTGSLEGGLAMYVGAGYDTSHPYVYKVKYELEVFRDCANGINRSAADLPSSKSGKTVVTENDNQPSEPAEEAEK